MHNGFDVDIRIQIEVINYHSSIWNLQELVEEIREQIKGDLKHLRSRFKQIYAKTLILQY